MSYQRPSEPIRATVDEALNRRVPWYQRARLWLSRIKSRTATMGGYWGGITMRDPRDKEGTK